MIFMTKDLGEEMDKGKRKKAIAFFMITAAVLTALSVGINIYNTPENRLARQLDAANTYLKEMDYGQAVTAFTKAVEMDPGNVESYLGMAEAYRGLDDTDMAVQTLEKGYEATGDERFLEEKQKYDYVIEWEDQVFESLIRQCMDKPEGGIYRSEIKEIKDLEITERKLCLYGEDHRLLTTACTEEEIQSLSDLQYFEGLTRLEAWYDYFDTGAISSLTGLTCLKLRGDHISDISALSNLTGLTYLDLTSNEISDISALSGLTNLEYLDLFDNEISNIDALSGLTNVTELYLRLNKISDISPLSNLTQLKSLDLSMNDSSDITILSNLTSLTYLILEYNDISDISALSSLTNLTWLELGHNQISDVRALSGLTKLEVLHLEWNQISEVSALSGLTNLTHLDLTGDEINDYSPVSFVPGTVIWFSH